MTDNSVIVFYAAIGLLGSVSGFVVFLQSAQQWKWRRVISTTLTGGLLAVASVAFWYGDATDNPWPAVAVAILIGMTQPKAHDLLAGIIKKSGIQVKFGNGNGNKSS